MEDTKHLENHYIIWILRHLLTATEVGKTREVLLGLHLIKLGNTVLYNAIMNTNAIHIPCTYHTQVKVEIIYKLIVTYMILIKETINLIKGSGPL